MRQIILLTISLLLTLLSCHTSKNTSNGKISDQQIKDEKDSTNMVSNTREVLLKPPYAEWFVKNYDEYKVDSLLADQFKNSIREKQISIFLGTWCGDSRREVPRMLKILDYCGLPSNRLQLILVSAQVEEYKQSPGHEESGLDIFRVPTLIINGKSGEEGRIIEYPVASLEEDLFNILKSGEYTPNYRAGSHLLRMLKEKDFSELEKNEENIAARLKQISKSSSELNSVGYVLLAAKNSRKAMLAFSLNTLMYPNDINVFNTLADAYLRLGDKAKAREALHKSRLLDPGNNRLLELEKRLEN
jgi:tetratricopeptide (TPR) repeat protein